jgi:HEAT repeat protein
MADEKRTKTRADAGPSPKDDRLALALARGATRAEAAREAGCSERTCYVRLSDPGFRALVGRHRKRLVDEAFGVLAKVAAPAFRELNLLLRDEDPKIRLSAARAIGVLLVRIGSYHAIDERISAVEEALKMRGLR